MKNTHKKMVALAATAALTLTVVLPLATACGKGNDEIKYETGSYAYEAAGDSATEIRITAYKGGGGENVAVPAKYDGKTVVEIDDGVFDGECSATDSANAEIKAIKNLKVSAGVKTVGSFNFANMDALETVTIEKGVETTGSGCFTTNPKLKTVSIGSGSVSLKSGAFSEDPALETVTLPADLEAAASTSFLESSTSITVNYAGSPRLFEMAVSAVDGDVEFTVKGYGGKTTEKADGYEYLLNSDGASYTFVGFTAVLKVEASAPEEGGGEGGEENEPATQAEEAPELVPATEVYIPTTYNGKNVTAIGDAALNANAYRNAEISAWLKDTVAAVDVNTAFQAHDTNITKIGRFNYVNLTHCERITMPVSLEQETLEGCFDEVRCRVHLRIPKGIVVLKDCFNYEVSWFYGQANAWNLLNVVLPNTLERFEGNTWNYSFIASDIASFMFFVDLDDAEAVAKFASILDNSIAGTPSVQTCYDYFKTFTTGAAGAYFCGGNGNAWAAAGFLPTSYQAVVDAGY